MEWTNETINRLSALWADGLSTAEIGRRMGISKNAVVGKAHRLLLSPRPSPIHRDGASDRLKRRPSTRRVLGPTLPSLAQPSAAAVAPLVTVSSVPAVPVVKSNSIPARIVHELSTMVASASCIERRRPVACCWPIGEPATRNFRFCDGESLPNKPYCAKHAALAYVKIRDRREDAA